MSVNFSTPMNRGLNFCDAIKVLEPHMFLDKTIKWKKITSKLVLKKDRTHALLNDVSNCWFPESIFIQIKKEINSNQLV